MRALLIGPGAIGLTVGGAVLQRADAALAVANRPPPTPRNTQFRSCPLSEKPRSISSSTSRIDFRYGPSRSFASSTLLGSSGLDGTTCRHTRLHKSSAARPVT